jgi:uncharacterized membrane protein
MNMDLSSYRLAKRETRERVAHGLGWFSIGLGLLELLAPRQLSKIIGAPPRTGLMRLLGLREIASGVGILTQAQPAPWLKSRVAGDVMDLGLLGVASLSSESSGGRLACATAAVAGVTVLDVLSSQDLSNGHGNAKARLGSRTKTVKIKRSVTINRPAELLYNQWHNFQQLPRFMSHLISVEPLEGKRSHWVAKGPAGSRAEWDAEIIQDHPNELIAWRSLENADVDNAGSVRFERARGGRGTVVRVQLEYRLPAGRIGARVAQLFGEAPEKQIAVDLLRFKQMVETGEVARTEGQPAGRSRSTSRKYDDLVRS